MKKTVLFIDRDGTLIVEPEIDKQVDSLDKLSFIPGVISALSKISKFLDYELVIVSNQDGLGTDSFPEENFQKPHSKMLEIFKGEGVCFSDILIDGSFEHENSNNRKPRTGMLKKYLNNPEYDLENSFVIGDRLTDLELASNIGAKSIYFKSLRDIDRDDIKADLCTNNWREIYTYLRSIKRSVECSRNTKETSISIKLSLDGTGESNISSGLVFFDHMLEQIPKHSGCNLDIKVEGDLEVDEHHTIEDTGIILGEALFKALGDKTGIERYSFILPMDESEVKVSLDFSGRSFLVWNAEFKREKIGDMPTEMFSHFFKSFTDSAKCTLHISALGSNEHHKIEAIFKAFAKCLREAWKLDFDNDNIPSTKGIL